MKRVLFKRILVSYLIMAPILFLFLELYISDVVKSNHISGLRESLIIQANLIAERISYPAADLDDFCRRYKVTTGARVTVVDSSGRVLGDSDEASANMANHANRPEIREAGMSDAGSSVRFSNTLGKDLFYLAVPVKRGEENIFLRLSLPLSDVEAAVAKTRLRMFLASFTALLIAILVGLFQTRKITRSIEHITAFSREIAAGHLGKRLFLKEKGEIGELARNINDMAHELEARLQQSEEEKHKAEAVIRNLSDGLMLVDSKGKVLLCNNAVNKLFVIETGIEGRTIAETLKSAELMEMTEEVLRKKESVSREVHVVQPRELFLMATVTPFYAHSAKEKPSGVVVTLHDITRLRRLEEMRKDFVANVSHEIKTPITAIKGFAETLLDGAIDDRENAGRFLETIKNHSERLNSLVTDLLTLSRIEMGDIRIEKHNVQIDGLIDTVFTTLGEKAKAKGLYLKKVLPSEPVEIYADRDKLIQMLLNLVDNGIKFTDDGGVTVSLQSSRFNVPSEGETGGTITGAQQVTSEILVEDTGVGIAKKHLPRLGERFYRVDRARSRELGGTGLGLAIVKHLVMAHGWTMEIESTQGKGTLVSIFVVQNPTS
ncbi:MAG TPA: ATP-binding protein [Thermodesulfovibrionales bacterium]|nr:ATP-binding protein [Thermodesulfovibrionales bacterium]